MLYLINLLFNTIYNFVLVIAINNCTLNGKDFVWTLVSRRSRYRHGPRLLKRGIDQMGNVANFVETEMIVEFNNTRSSYVQVYNTILITIKMYIYLESIIFCRLVGQFHYIGRNTQHLSINPWYKYLKTKTI